MLCNNVKKDTHGLISALSDEFRQAFNCPEFRIDVRGEWGSQTPLSRLAIRQTLVENLNEYFKDFGGQTKCLTELNSLTDLTKIPAQLISGVSISHCRSMGGFAHLPGDQAIGFDIEETERITISVAKRVSSSEELNRAPAMDLLWVAKESAFKALASTGVVELLSTIEIGNWQQIKSSNLESETLWSFRATALANELTIQAHGICARSQGYAMAIALLASL